MTVRAVYALTGDVRDAWARAEALAVEQSISHSTEALRDVTRRRHRRSTAVLSSVASLR